MITIARKATAIWALLILSSSVAEAGRLRQLKRIHVSGDSQVSLVFDGDVDVSRIKTEFFNDIVQLSLSDVAVYPAKISNVDTPELSKIFAYQYAPNLTRCRLTVKGKAEEFQKKLKISPDGRSITIDLRGGGSVAQVAAPSAEKVAAAAPAVVVAPVAAIKAPVSVVSSTPAGVLGDSLTGRKSSSAPKTLTGDRPLPSPWRALGVLAAIVGLLVGVALLIRKARGDGIQTHKRFPRFAAGLMRQFGAAPGNKRPAIQVIASHHLGPKKSISVVKVAGRTLVLGVTDDSINLISQLEDDDSGEEAIAEALTPKNPVPPASSKYGAGAVAAGPAQFSDIFRVEADKPTTHSPTVRTKIRDRLQGMKEF